MVFISKLFLFSKNGNTHLNLVVANFLQSKVLKYIFHDSLKV